MLLPTSYFTFGISLGLVEVLLVSLWLNIHWIVSFHDHKYQVLHWKIPPPPKCRKIQFSFLPLTSLLSVVTYLSRGLSNSKSHRTELIICNRIYTKLCKFSRLMHALALTFTKINITNQFGSFTLINDNQPPTTPNIDRLILSVNLYITDPIHYLCTHIIKSIL